MLSMQPENERVDQGKRSFIEAARRAQIVAAAIETIAEIGYAKASFVQIARRAGISPGLITYHFTKREELIKQVMVTVHESMDAALSDRASNAPSYAAALRALIEGYVHYCAEHPHELIAISRIAANADEARDWAQQQQTTALAELEDMFREGQQHGEFRAFSPRVMALAVMAALETAPTELVTRPDTDVAAFAEELATVFERAVKP
jgi:AcrR family transcriptional regulator